MARTLAPNGAVIYRGPSMLDGAPIVVIATGLRRASKNGKTGNEIQTWILREDMAPQAALDTGADASICGGCNHRGTVVDGANTDRGCYVIIFQAPRNVHESYHRGIYPVVAPSDLPALFAGRTLRLGSYGDPAAVPVSIWLAALERTIAHTGYTHQWRNPVAAPLVEFCMASADSSADRAAANAAGWRTFRVRAADGAIERREVVCPASHEAGKRTTCEDCRACGGTRSKARADIVIIAHGNGAKHATACAA